MYRFRSTKYVSVTGLIIALIVVVGIICYAIRVSSRGLFQISDGLLLSLAVFIPGPMMLVAGPISGGVIDLIFGSFPYIPMTMIIHFLMPLLAKFLAKLITRCGAIGVASCLTMIYPAYEFMLSYLSGLGIDGASSAAIVEAITDAVQTGVTIVFGIVLFVVLDRINIKSHNHLWDDGQFTMLHNWTRKQDRKEDEKDG